jgi:hypothetical protein
MIRRRETPLLYRKAQPGCSVIAVSTDPRPQAPHLRRQRNAYRFGLAQSRPCHDQQPVTRSSQVSDPRVSFLKRTGTSRVCMFGTDPQQDRRLPAATMTGDAEALRGPDDPHRD